MKCIEISLENLYVDIGTLRVKVLRHDHTAARRSFFLIFTSCVQIFDSFDKFRLTQNQSKLKTFWRQIITV